MSSPAESSSNPPPTAAGTGAAAKPAGTPASPAPAAAEAPPQLNLAELLALAKTVLAAQQQQQQNESAGQSPAPVGAAPAPAAATPAAAEPRAWERKKFFKLTPEQAAAAAAAKATLPATATDPAAVTAASSGEPVYGAPVSGSLAADPLAPASELAGSESDPELGPILAGDDVPRRRRGARITPQLGHAPRPARRPSRLPLWISAITLIGGLGLGWVIYPRLQKPVPPPADAPDSSALGSKAPGTAELMAMPPLPPDSVAVRASAPEPATVRALALVDQGITAEKARQIEKAVRFYEEAYNEDARVPGAAYRLAELSMRRGDLPKATLWVNRALAVGENTAACFSLRGVIAARSGNLRAGIVSLTAAVHADPLTARWYFFLAQMLRRGGKLQDAEQRLQQAIQRAEDPQQEEYFNFLLRLTRIELGGAEKLLPELQSKLDSPTPPADWLLTAAAVELQRGKLEAAAALMSRAFQNQSKAYAASRLEDVYFRNFEATKEISPLYATYLPRGGRPPDAAGGSRSSAALVSPGLLPAVTSMQQPPGQRAPTSSLPASQFPGAASGAAIPLTLAPGTPSAPVPPLGPGMSLELTPGSGSSEGTDGGK